MLLSEYVESLWYSTYHYGTYRGQSSCSIVRNRFLTCTAGWNIKNFSFLTVRRVQTSW